MVVPHGSPDELRPGDRVGRYLLEMILGEGGSGIVFLAARDGDGGRVALKVLRASLASDPTNRRRFEHETRSATALRHPHVVPLLEAGEFDGRPFLVSRYMSGGSLSVRLDSVGALPVMDALRIVGEVASGLDALHAAGIIHRDVKPANILLESDGTAAIGDLGLARGARDTMLTMPGQVLGTMDYLAPELIRGHPASVASDVYALGCAAYAAFTGSPPFGGRSAMRAAFAHLEETPVDPSTGRPQVDVALGRAILAALAKAPEDRSVSAGAYADALRIAARN